MVRPTRAREYRRRTMIATLGVGTVGALSGCLGNGDDGDDDDSGTSDTSNSGDEEGEGSWEEAYYSDPEEIFGNPVRRTPSDPDELEDPDTLNFAYVPAEEPAVLEEAFDPMIEMLEENTGKNVEYFGGQNYASLIEAMRSGRLHLGAFGAAALVYAVNMSGAQPFVAHGDQDDSIGYTALTISHADSDITEPEDLIGRTVAHADPGSTSGDLLPRAFFEQEYGIVPEEDYDVEYSGGHDQSMLGVYHGDYEVAHISDGGGVRAMERHEIESREDVPDNMQNFNLVVQSAEIPSVAYATWYRLEPELRDQIQETFVGYEFEGKMAEHFGDEYWYKEVEYVEDYELPRQLQEFAGVEFTDDELDEL